MLFKSIRFSFSQARKLPNIWAIQPESYIQMANALFGAYSTQQFGTLLRDNLDAITDQQVAYALTRIQHLNLDADQHFHDLVVPVLKDFVSNFERDHAESLAQIVQCCGQLNVQDAELWQLFEQKLLKERLYRYIPLTEIVEMTYQVAQSDFGSENFFKTMEAQISKHKLALTSEQVQLCADAFERKRLAAPIIKQLREQATKQLA